MTHFQDQDDNGVCWLAVDSGDDDKGTSDYNDDHTNYNDNHNDHNDHNHPSCTDDAGNVLG